jgi:PPOX class probable F420-dependent enzyme
MVTLSPAARTLLESDALAHLVTLGSNGSPQVTCIWVGLDGDEIVSGHLGPQRKLQNVRSNPRVVMSLESSDVNDWGLREYMVVHGQARLEAGGAAELLQRLAHTYLGPEVVFPNMPDPPPGVVMRTAIERVGGMGTWEVT